MNKILTYASLIVSLCTTTIWAVKVDLEVYASQFDSIPIGIIEFKGEGTIDKKDIPSNVIANDFFLSTRFSVVKIPEFDSAAFYRGNVGIYIDGNYSVVGNNVTIECLLYDAVSRELIIGKKYEGDKKLIRSMAHKYANEMVEMLFGDRGFFQSQIVYVKAEGKNKSIGIMDFDGYNQRDLTDNKVINLFPAFIDSSSYLFISYLKGKPDIYKGSTETKASKIFIQSRAVQTSPDVSPVDGSIVFASSKGGNMDVYRCEPDGSDLRQLTKNYSVETSPTFSPNGYQIAFTSDRTGYPSIYIMDANGENQRRLTFEGRYHDSPSWSPKGDKIAYASMSGGDKFDIWVINADGTGATQITNLSGNNEYPTWSPDGNLIAFVNIQGSRSDLYFVKPDGTKLRRVTTTGNIKMPDWGGF